jgi:integrase
MSKFQVESAVEALNQRLKAACVAVTVEVNGGKLMMRSTLPKKLKDGVGMKQYRLSLGISANRDGIKVIEAKAHELRRQVENGVFEWAEWERSRTPKRHEISVAQLVEQFKAYYLSKGKITEATWIDQWERTYSRLPQSEALTEASLLAAVLSTDANTDTRKRTCQRMQALADFAGLDIDLSEHSGTYGYAAVKPRDLPDDDLIVIWRDRVPNPAWQWVYGMMATFGLRPHEVFFCEFIDSHTVKILEETKTGSHVARAFPPEWSERWHLIEVKRPPVSGSRPSDYGNRNKRQFQRYEVPFPAYNLRHAYALRGSLKYGMDTREMAQMMGHAETTHIRTYRRWLSEIEVQKSYDEKVLKKSL